MIPAVWLLSLPFRLLAALGLRRSVILACLFVLAVTAYGVAEDLGLIEPPAQAAPARKPAAGCRPKPTRAAAADIPGGYLRLYCQAGARSRGALDGAGRHRQGRVRPRPGPAARGPLGQQLGRGVRADAVRLCARAARPATPGPATASGRPHDPADAIPAAARYLVDHGARRDLDRAIFAYNHSRAYVAQVKQLARRYAGVAADGRPLPVPRRRRARPARAPRPAVRRRPLAAPSAIGRSSGEVRSRPRWTPSGHRPSAAVAADELLAVLEARGRLRRGGLPAALRPPHRGHRPTRAGSPPTTPVGRLTCRLG